MMRHISLLKLSKLTGDYFFDSKEVKQESGMSCIFIVLFFYQAGKIELTRRPITIGGGSK